MVIKRRFITKTGGWHLFLCFEKLFERLNLQVLLAVWQPTAAGSFYCRWPMGKLGSSFWHICHIKLIFSVCCSEKNAQTSLRGSLQWIWTSDRAQKHTETLRSSGQSATPQLRGLFTWNKQQRPASALGPWARCTREDLLNNLQNLWAGRKTLPPLIW